MAINMQLSSLAVEIKGSVVASENTVADDLTNGISDQVDSSKQMEVSWDAIPLDVVLELVRTRSAFEADRKRVKLDPAVPKSNKKKRFDKSPW